MIALIFFLVLLAIALLAIALRKTYSVLPPGELRRRARGGDSLARLLDRAVAFGASLNILLWTIIVLAVAGSFALLATIVPGWLAFIVEVVVIGYGFVWMPRSRVSAAGERLAAWLTPAVVWTLGYLNPLLERVAAYLRHFRPVTLHTGLYERDDLLELLERQRGQPDSRLSHETLDLAARGLTFADKTVAGCLTPRRVVRAVNLADDAGPMLMKELHDSGHSRFPVWEKREDNIVGTLYLRDLVRAKQGGRVDSLMSKDVYFVHEDLALQHVLEAFLKTKHHLFIVVNSFEEYVGVITIEDLLEQIIGAKIVDEFDQYDDLRAVASSIAKKQHAEHKKSKQEPAKENPPEAEETAQATSEPKDKVK